MVKTKGSNALLKVIFKEIHDISCLGIGNKGIYQYYNLYQSTVSNIILRLRCASNTVVNNKRMETETIKFRYANLPEVCNIVQI